MRNIIELQFIKVYLKANNGDDEGKSQPVRHSGKDASKSNYFISMAILCQLMQLFNHTSQ